MPPGAHDVERRVGRTDQRMEEADHIATERHDLVEAIGDGLGRRIAEPGHRLALVLPDLEAGPHRQAGRETRLDDPFAMNVAPGRFGDQEIDPGLGQYVGLLAEIRPCLGLGGLASPLLVVSLAGDPQTEVRDGTGNQRRTVSRRPVTGVLCQHDGAQVEFDDLVAETEGLEVVAGRRNRCWW